MKPSTPPGLCRLFPFKAQMLRDNETVRQLVTRLNLR
jgi:hypothetical protein